MTGDRERIGSHIRALSRQLAASKPHVAQQLASVAIDRPSGVERLLRDVAPTEDAVLPTDLDSRLALIRYEGPQRPHVEPIWSPSVFTALDQVVTERSRSAALSRANLSPSRTLLFTGPPGVGKSLAARWLSHQLVWPLLTLDLGSVMSSFLGRTGANIKQVLEYAKELPCILLLDEFDAIAKRRDDQSEIGELKRLVTVLLQEIDRWPTSSILVAATNHAELLDPATWRRFDVQIDFSVPTKDQIYQAAQAFWADADGPISKVSLDILAIAFDGASFNDLERFLLTVRRQAVVRSENAGALLEEAVCGRLLSHSSEISHRRRIEVAGLLIHAGFSQRRVHELTGVSRDTIRKHVKQ